MCTYSSDIPILAEPDLVRDAELIASQFHLSLIPQGEETDAGYRLYLGSQRLELQNLDTGAAGPAFVDFVNGRARHRRLYGGGKGQPLARAVGVKGGRLPNVLDATAGFGRDSFVLATMGCQVTMLERSPIFAALLSDALKRAALNAEITDIVGRMKLNWVDAKVYLSELKEDSLPDTIYLDPMYPHRRKSALVKKEMRIARDLAGDDQDAAELMEVAQSRAIPRIVVKRPRSGATLSSVKPTIAIQSENTRYDIYIRTIHS